MPSSHHFLQECAHAAAISGADKTTDATLPLSGSKGAVNAKAPPPAAIAAKTVEEKVAGRGAAAMAAEAEAQAEAQAKAQAAADAAAAVVEAAQAAAMAVSAAASATAAVAAAARVSEALQMEMAKKRAMPAYQAMVRHTLQDFEY